MGGGVEETDEAAAGQNSSRGEGADGPAAGGWAEELRWGKRMTAGGWVEASRGGGVPAQAAVRGEDDEDDPNIPGQGRLKRLTI